MRAVGPAHRLDRALIEGARLELELPADGARALEEGDELLAGEVIVALPGILPVIGGIPAVEDVLETVRLHAVHVSDEAAKRFS